MNFRLVDTTDWDQVDLERTQWTRAFINGLPDSAFLYVETGGQKDSDGKTKPRSLRHFPYKDASGKIDLPHLKNALSRIPQASLPQAVKDRLAKKAKRILTGISRSEPFPLESEIAELEVLMREAGLEARAANTMVEYEITYGGAHRHGMTKTGTGRGGAHRHIFMMVDGTPLVTDLDGTHEHLGEEDQLALEPGGEHTHLVRMPDGETVWTSTDGTHGHAVLGYSTALDGPHTHILKVDNQKLVSLTPYQTIHVMSDGKLNFEMLDRQARPRLVFVVWQPAAMDVARGYLLSGPDGAIFQDNYLAPLGLQRADVRVLSAYRDWVPAAYQTDAGLGKALASLLAGVERDDLVVALGSDAGRLLGSRADLVLPHPAVWRRGQLLPARRGEAKRKLALLRTRLEGLELEGPRQPPQQLVPGRSQGAKLTTILRADEELRVVSGVVLSPHYFDTYNSWFPPKVIEETAHDWLVRSRQIDNQHTAMSASAVVESFIVPYPTKEDRQKALDGEPHKVVKWAYGTDFIRSGEWVCSVKLTEAEWGEYKAGKINGFSIKGLGVPAALGLGEKPPETTTI